MTPQRHALLAALTSLACVGGVLVGPVAASATVVAPSSVGDAWQAYSWGLNLNGQLGNGTTIDGSVPGRVLAGSNPVGTWSSIGAAGTFSCGVSTDGGAFCWGENGQGQLGNGSVNTSDDSLPGAVSDGDNLTGLWTFVDGGWEYACGLDRQGAAYCWGDNSSGQLGNATIRVDASLPGAVLPGANSSGVWTALTVGYGSACGLTASATAYCWGDNFSGQLGLGTNGPTDDSVPNMVQAGANLTGTWRSIAAGSSQTCGIATDGKAYCWGSNNDGRLGNGQIGTMDDSLPVAVVSGGSPGLWKKIDTGEWNSCAISIDDALYCWGDNSQGQLGQGASRDDTGVPLLVPIPEAVIDVAVGDSTICASTAQDVYCWGKNNRGQVGNGTSPTLSDVPVKVTSTALSGLQPKDLDLGYDQALLLVGSASPTPPVPVSPASPPTDVVAVAGDASASVSWQAPASSGSFAVTDYQVIATPGGSRCVIAVPERSCEVPGLVNGTAYTFIVQALNGAGWSLASDPSNSVIPRPQARPTIVITGARDGRSAVVSGDSSGLVGARVTPQYRFPGQVGFTDGSGTRTVGADGEFTWQRRTGRQISVRFATAGVISNVVRIPRR